MKVPAGLRQLRQEAITDWAEGQRRSLERIGAGANLAALQVLPQTPIDIVTALASLADLFLQVGVAVSHDRHKSAIFLPGGRDGAIKWPTNKRTGSAWACYAFPPGGWRLVRKFH